MDPNPLLKPFTGLTAGSLMVRWNLTAGPFPGRQATSKIISRLKGKRRFLLQKEVQNSKAYLNLFKKGRLLPLRKSWKFSSWPGKSKACLERHRMWNGRSGEQPSISLQARPITTLVGEDRDEQRRWYLNLKLSFENLKELRKAIEYKYIPEMKAEARELGKEKLPGLSDPALVEEIEKRAEIYQKWYSIYWDEFIPFAPGAR